MSSPIRGRAHNILRFNQNPLDLLFAPRTVAVIGATEREGSIGRTLLWNLLNNNFGGTVFAVNPNHENVLGIPCYPTVADLPEAIDLAVIATPPHTVPALVQQCVDQNIPGAIIVSSGFKETGTAGAALEAEIWQIAHPAGLRIIGPNCLGVMNTVSGLNATFAPDMARTGTVGFISQSGALGTAILDWSFRENVGFSAFVSVGSMLDVDWADLIYYLGDDPRTKSIVMYMETIGNARAFLSAAREVALAKPIIVLKPGRTPEAEAAAMRHTGSQTGTDEVLAAAFRRSGVLRVNTISELFNMAEVLAKQPRPRGPRLTIVSNAGGPGVLAADALVGAGGTLTPLSSETMAALQEALPPAWSQANPIDILGDADALRYETAVQIAANDANGDGLLVILTPQAVTQPTRTAQKLQTLYGRPARYAYGKPVLACWMGDANVSAGKAILNQANIPTFAFPDMAAQAFYYMWRYQKRLDSLYETPHLPNDAGNDEHRVEITAEIERIRANGRTELTPDEASRLLTAYGLTMADAATNPSAPEYPVSLRAWPDAQFGPIIQFGAGGPLGELFQDWVLGLPPLTTTLARRMIERTRIFAALAREDAELDLAALDSVSVRFAELIITQPWVREIQLNPLQVSAVGCVVQQAQVTLYGPEIQATDLPALAIRPYPTQYAQPFITRKGDHLTIRPIRAEDEPMVVTFHKTLSERSVYLRYFRAFNFDQRTSHERLVRICHVDYDREIVLVAEKQESETADPVILGIGRLTKARTNDTAEFALLISDAYQGHGLGTELLRRLLEIGRSEGVSRVEAYILGENRSMIHLCEKLGFTFSRDGETVKAVIELAQE